ncbi:MAG TPA: M56 family metallopeptidase [Thermoanaerobaculia bacterium]|nr:M56 family metallopeptidase [Thermoanaerobaculia bacterium]
MFDVMIPPMIPQDLASQAVAWLLTYTLHSTLFLGLAWLASRRLARRMPAVEEAVWRFALVAGLITASLQLAVGREPLTGSWSLAPAAVSVVNASVPSAVPPPRAVDLRTAESIPAVPRSEVPVPTKFLHVSLPAALAGVWLAGALLLAASWWAAHLRLRRRLRPRPQVLEATMVTLLGELRERAGLERRVRLSCSSRLPVPVALGLRRPEICVPPRALASLAPEQQEGMLAHELAHLVRRDPFWLAFGRLLASALFFQPLNWVAVRRLRELSELLCDEWAVGRTGRPVSLARCLAEVAGWSLQPLRSLPAPGMADRPSHLGRRIRRLLEEARSPQRRVHPAWLAAGMVILVVTVAAAAPGVHAAVAGDPEEEIAEAAEPMEAPEPAELAEMAAEEDREDAIEAVEAEIDGEDLDASPEVAGDINGDLTGLTENLGEISQIATEIAMDLSGDLMAATMAGDLSEEEADELGRRIDKLFEGIGRQMEERLEPQMKALEERLEKDLAPLENSEEMRELERRAEAIAERARPSEEEMAKLRANIDRLRAEGGLSEEDKRKIREEARRMAQENRLTDKDRAEIAELQRQARAMAQRSMGEHQVEIDQMRQQIREEARAMREEIRRQLDNDPQLRALRERRKEEREHSREDRDRDRSRERAPRPPRPERHVQLQVAPEIRVQVEPAVAPVAETRVDVRIAPEVAPVAERPGRTERPAIAPRPRVHVHVTPAVAPAARRQVDVKVRPEVAPAAEAPEALETPTPAEAPEPPAR